jgi:uncharacterized protein (DUF885 family)
MTTTRKWILGLAGALVLAAGVFVVPTVWFRPWSVEHYYARTFLHFAARSPMLLSQLRVVPGWMDFYSGKLDERSVAFQQEQARWLDRQVDVLHSYRRDRLEDPLSYDVLDWFMTNQQSAARYQFHGYPLNQMFGEQSNVPNFLLNVHQINTPKDARNYVRRLEAVERYFDEVLEDVRHRESLGVVPPRFVIQRVLKEMRDFTAMPPREHVLFTHFVSATEGVEGLRSTRRRRLIVDAERAVAERVYPVYARMIAEYERLETVATTDDGVWKLPDGEGYYAHLLRNHTTTDMTAEEIHQTGLREVERIHAEMREILVAEGYDATDLGATMAALHREPRFAWPDSDDGRQQILARYQELNDEITAGLDGLFGMRPRAPMAVERVPTFREATSAGAYYTPPPMDGSKPGIFWANLRNVEEHAKFTMRTLTYHEGVPGHHFQIALAMEQTGVPFFRRVVPFTAYSEGWALYAEQVAAEHGFQDDPYDRLGYLTAQLFRAVRLVVDTGIHSQRWTRERAIEYMLTSTGMPETDVVSEIERYIVMPGQATAYMVGRLKILEIREDAMARLGERFSLPEFHDVVLGGGAMPLTLLEQRVNAWVESRGGTRG